MFVDHVKGWQREGERRLPPGAVLGFGDCSQWRLGWGDTPSAWAEPRAGGWVGRGPSAALGRSSQDSPPLGGINRIKF